MNLKCNVVLFLWIRDYNEFLNDLEEDPQLRQNVNIFKDSSKLIPVDVNDGIDPSVPRITLEEMLDDLVLEDDEMGEEIWVNCSTNYFYNQTNKTW